MGGGVVSEEPEAHRNLWFNLQKAVVSSPHAQLPTPTAAPQLEGRGRGALECQLIPELWNAVHKAPAAAVSTRLASHQPHPFVSPYQTALTALGSAPLSPPFLEFTLSLN